MYKGTTRVFYITCYVDIETGEFINKNKYNKKEWRILDHDINYEKREINTENGRIEQTVSTRTNYIRKHEQYRLF